jgi:hypothetical protein
MASRNAQKPGAVQQLTQALSRIEDAVVNHECTPQQALEAVVSAIGKLECVNTVLIAVRCDADFLVRAASGYAPAPNTPVEYGDLYQTCLSSNRMLRCEDLVRDERFGNLRMRKTLSFMLLPVSDNGVLAAFSPAEHGLNVEHILPLSSAATIVSLLLPMVAEATEAAAPAKANGASRVNSARAEMNIGSDGHERHLLTDSNAQEIPPAGQEFRSVHTPDQNRDRLALSDFTKKSGKVQTSRSPADNAPDAWGEPQHSPNFSTSNKMLKESEFQWENPPEKPRTQVRPPAANDIWNESKHDQGFAELSDRLAGRKKKTPKWIDFGRKPEADSGPAQNSLIRLCVFAAMLIAAVGAISATVYVVRKEPTVQAGLRYSAGSPATCDIIQRIGKPVLAGEKLISPPSFSGGRVIQEKLPECPTMLKSAGASVNAVLSVSSKGIVEHVRVAGESPLDDQTASALAHWRFAPFLSNERPVTVDVPISIAFRPKG